MSDFGETGEQGDKFLSADCYNERGSYSFFFFFFFAITFPRSRKNLPSVGPLGVDYSSVRAVLPAPTDVGHMFSSWLDPGATWRHQESVGSSRTLQAEHARTGG